MHFVKPSRQPYTHWYCLIRIISINRKVFSSVTKHHLCTLAMRMKWDKISIRFFKISARNSSPCVQKLTFFEMNNNKTCPKREITWLKRRVNWTMWNALTNFDFELQLQLVNSFTNKAETDFDIVLQTTLMYIHLVWSIWILEDPLAWFETSNARKDKKITLFLCSIH